jgi:hypothetical protein
MCKVVPLRGLLPRDTPPRGRRRNVSPCSGHSRAGDLSIRNAHVPPAFGRARCAVGVDTGARERCPGGQTELDARGHTFVGWFAVVLDVLGKVAMQPGAHAMRCEGDGVQRPESFLAVALRCARSIAQTCG